MGWGLLGNWEFGKWIGLDLFTNRWCVYKHGLEAPINVPMLSPCLFINARRVYKHGFGTRIVAQYVIITVNANTHTDTTLDIGWFKTHVHISVSHDAYLGARSSLFITNTTANRNCDADINRNTGIYTSMDVSNTKAT